MTGTKLSIGKPLGIKQIPICLGTTEYSDKSHICEKCLYVDKCKNSKNRFLVVRRRKSCKPINLKRGTKRGNENKRGKERNIN